MNKKNYTYFIAPLVGLVLFAAVYWNFISKYDAEQDSRAARQKAEKNEKLKKEQDLKQEAYKQALEASERRDKERKEKTKKDEADRESRQAAIEGRDKSKREEFKLADRVKALSKEIELAKKEVTEAEENKKRTQAEEAFQRTYVKQADANQKSLAAVLENIQKADDAAEAVRKAAEEAAKKSKK